MGKERSVQRTMPNGVSGYVDIGAWSGTVYSSQLLEVGVQYAGDTVDFIIPAVHGISDHNYVVPAFAEKRSSGCDWVLRAAVETYWVFLTLINRSGGSGGAVANVSVRLVAPQTGDFVWHDSSGTGTLPVPPDTLPIVWASGLSGASGYSGKSGYSGTIGISGYSGKSGYSGFKGNTGNDGLSGYSGQSGASGFTGRSGISGRSGFSGTSGDSGTSGESGVSGTSGDSGTSGESGVSGYSGTSGLSGYSGWSGPGTLIMLIAPAFSTYGDGTWSSVSGYSAFMPAGTPMNVRFNPSTPDNPANQKFTLNGPTMAAGFGTVSLQGSEGVETLAINDATGKVSTTGDWYGILEAESEGWLVPAFQNNDSGNWHWYNDPAHLPADPSVCWLLVDTGSVLSYTPGPSGVSGFSGYSGFTGMSGFTGVSGDSGISGFSGTYSGFSGDSGISGFSGYSGFTGMSGSSGVSGFSGTYSGFSGWTGDSGTSGFADSGTSGFSGTTGGNGESGTSGVSGDSGISGFSGFTGFSGISGESGISGFTGISGASAFSGESGASGFTGTSGMSGSSGVSGFSGWTGVSGTSGFTGTSGFSGSVATPPCPNVVRNGDFNVAQRGASFAAIASASYSLDGWRYIVSGSAVHTITQDTDVPTAAQSGHLSSYSIKLDCTTADSSLASTDLSVIGQVIEGYDAARIAQRPFTLSFWVKAVKAGIYCVSFRNSGNDRSYVAEYTVNVTNTWEKKVINVLASPTAGTWLYTTGIGLRVYWILACGSAYRAAQAGDWESGNKLCTSNQVNGTDSTDNDFWLSQVKIEPGTLAATDFVGEDPATELARCQRYLTAWGGVSTEWTAMGWVATTSIAGIVVPLPTTMRAAPAVGYSAVSDWQIRYAGVGESVATAISILNADKMDCGLSVTVTGTPLTAGEACALHAIASAASRLYLSAEL